MDTAAKTSKPVNPMANVLRHRDFRLLWLGQATSLIGDQFAMIAMPWLVLWLTDDPLVLGTVLALAGIPRAIFMLVGGAIVDRFSPRTVMLVSDILRLFLVSMLAVLVFTATIQLWMLYMFSLVFGLLAGFFLPASISVVPSLVQPEELQAGNAMFQGTGQLAGLIGPTLAGAVIGWFAHLTSSTSSELPGIGLALCIDAITFIVSIVTLWAIRTGRMLPSRNDESVLQLIGAGIRNILQQPFVRVLFMISALFNFLFLGPLLVGIPLLASTRLAEGVVGFGLIMSAFAGGNLVGAIVAGNTPKPNRMKFHHFVIALLIAFGITLAILGWIHSTWVAFLVMFLLSIGNGYFVITTITLLQQSTPREMLGRLMSLLLFASTGLLPLSEALSGAVSRWSLTALFVGSGALMLLVALWTATQSVFFREDSTAVASAAD
jgi:MFS family permease